ncbi:amidohydrolase family protein [Spirosoma utsteinense]|uniref:TIM-barrel fold metal-dependent hydrolase n=1 Tax=Spirosoma utsteinense TaxID=2585773 RepID=A0ABR6WA33_9BACT|nr:amidohydrolase family protein [Spirosoma utsteinense]MBC3787332.1 putative TIM-barrel fold metal-dependent hydrolase [Spirosoma utsteinense]MBC3793114.1 putative TIM-barrel fold metal-dependent hydrolase [Spirosoma utsteinense]
MIKQTTIFFLATSIAITSACGQPKPTQPAEPLGFEEYDPVSTLKVPEHKLSRSKYPFIDVHNHQWNMDNASLRPLLSQMDSLNMGIMINLSGRGWGSVAEGTKFFDNSLANISKNDAKRLVLFTNINFDDIGRKGWTEEAVSLLAADVKKGAKGLKIYKSLGINNKDDKGQRIQVDDPRLDPIWAKCGELGIPVLIHTADPKSFWDPMDRYNERWLELKLHGGRKRAANDPVPWEKLIAEQHNVFRKHKKTTFIAAHMDWFPNDLTKLDSLMQVFPNMNVEIGAVIAELGRQPKASRTFFEKYQDRILFGKDSWVPSEYATYFRVLETDDEYFPYHKKYHAFWRMYGMALPDEVLKKVYYKNALRLIPGLDKSQFPN